MNEIDYRRDLIPQRNRLYRLAMGILRDSAEAEDTVEDTLLRVWEESRNKVKKLQPIANLSAYLTTICRNLALDRAEKCTAQNVSLDTQYDCTDTDATPPDATIDPDEQQQRYQLALRLIHALNEPQRSCILLRDVEGFTYQQIAEALNLTEAQVKVNIHRGRLAVREKANSILL